MTITIKDKNGEDKKVGMVRYYLEEYIFAETDKEKVDALSNLPEGYPFPIRENY